MSLTNEEDLSNVCRVCLEKSGKLYPLEGDILNVDVYICTMISYCTSVEVVLDKDLPTGVCVPCFRTIRIAYNFIKQFKETNERLLLTKKLKKKQCVDDLQEDCDDTEDMIELKEEVVEEEELNESIANDLSEPSSDRNCFSPEEKIIITYVNDKSGSDHELESAEILSENNEEISEDNKKIIMIKEDPSSRNILLNRHVCPICDKIFHDFRGGLIKHLYHHHHNNLIKCNKCSLGVELSTDLYVQHYTKYHLYQCPICNRKLGSKSSFYYHSKCHINGSAYHCPHQNCRKAFQTQFSLRKHLHTHSDAPKYICSKCGKNFNTYDTFRYHNKTHDGKRNHLCNVCGRTFLQSVHLKYHMWHHTGIKQFHCDDCGKSYTSVTQLKKHRRKYCGSVRTSDK
ncbi:zinc finger protein 41-like [Anoplophora glabripennis]|uniref:zinc finger protein 41-like n=1 Tax=Anoplophora glabripennis TaxID=217634 RepID=UPI00087423DA|nr:zinc finger protein 41-like [Anoplophora glabripennis]